MALEGEEMWAPNWAKISPSRTVQAREGILCNTDGNVMMYETRDGVPVEWEEKKEARLDPNITFM